MFNTEEPDKPLLKKNPLFLPQGSVRAIITLSMLLITTGLFMYKMEIPEWFSTLVVSGVSFYYGTRKVTTNIDIDE